MYKVLRIFTAGIISSLAVLSPIKKDINHNPYRAQKVTINENYSLEECESYEISYSMYQVYRNSASKGYVNYVGTDEDEYKWSFDVYYFSSSIGYVDCLKTQFSVNHKKDVDSVSATVSTSFTKSYSHEQSHGGTFKVKGNGSSYAYTFINASANTVEKACSVNINKTDPTGIYDLYIIDKRADAVVKATKLTTKNVKYLLMKKIPYGRGAEFSILKPVPSCNKYKSICS